MIHLATPSLLRKPRSITVATTEDTKKIKRRATKKRTGSEAYQVEGGPLNVGTLSDAAAKVLVVC